MSKYLFSFLIALIVVAFSQISIIHIAEGNPITKTLSLSTGDISLGPVKVMIDYSIQADLNHPPTALKGSTIDCKVSLRNGKVTITVSVAGQRFSHTADLPLGKRVEVPVAIGVKAFLYTTVSTPIQVSGKGESDLLSLDFLSEGTRSFKVHVSEGAMEGDSITISLPMHLNIKVGLKIDLLIFKADIAEEDIGSFKLNPTLESSLRITERPVPSSIILPGSSHFAIEIGIVLISGALGLSLFIQRRQLSSRKNILQGIVGVIAGVLCMISLWFPWVTYGGSQLTGIDLGSFLFQLTKISILQFLMYLILLLTLLLILGGYLHLAGFVAGRSLISAASRWLVALSLLLLIGLSFVFDIMIEVWGVIMIFGAILGVISLALTRE